MTTWTPTLTNRAQVPLLAESGFEITTESGVTLLITDAGDLWEEDNVPTDIWTKRNE